MHGVKRVPESERDHVKEALKLEKAAKFKKLSTEVIRRRRKGVFDDDSMTLTSKVLEINPEFYSAWNLRRLIIEDALQKSRATEGGEVAVGGGGDVNGAEWMLRKELELLQAAIAHNAKVYCLWHHRLWVVDKLVQIGDQGVLESEIGLCDQMLKMDERNFHCWGYRQKMAQKAGLGPKEGLEFTKQKIDRNFSNYSAWHYRSAFLEQVAASPGAGGREGLLKSLEDEKEVGERWLTVLHSHRTRRPHRTLIAHLVQGAVFTDPEDQSPWLYLRWIIAKSTPAMVRVTVSLSPSSEEQPGKSISLAFSQSVWGVDGRSVSVRTSAGSEVEGKWAHMACRPPRHSHSPPPCSEAWVFNTSNLMGEDLVVVSVVDGGGVKTTGGRMLGPCTITVGGMGSWRADAYVATISEAGELRAEAEPTGETVGLERERWMGVLREQLTVCKELLEVEPDCKWAMLTQAFLLSLQLRTSVEGGGGGGEEIEVMSSLIHKLQAVDSVRSAFYSHMGSNVLLSNAIHNWVQQQSLVTRDFTLSSCGLTHMDPTMLSMLAGITRLDLSDNKLTSCKGIIVLPGLLTLNLARNKITSLWSLEPLTSVTSLNLSSNSIKSLPDLEPLLSLTGLRDLNISLNDVVTTHACEAQSMLQTALSKTSLTF